MRKDPRPVFTWGRWSRSCTHCPVLITPTHTQTRGSESLLLLRSAVIIMILCRRAVDLEHRGALPHVQNLSPDITENTATKKGGWEAEMFMEAR